MPEDNSNKIPHEMMMIAENQLRRVGITPTTDAARAYLLGVFRTAKWNERNENKDGED